MGQRAQELLTIASVNFPNADEHGAVAPYGLVTAAMGGLYTLWMRRRAATPLS